MPRFYPPDAPAPERLETEDFVVRWITVADTEMDYAALRAAMPYYMEINPADWRDRTFSLEDNREEMHRHEAENRAHESFTMIVTDPRGERSYGCVYFADLYSLLRAGGAPTSALEAVGDDECQVHLFLVPESLEWELDERLVRALIDWLDADWAFRRWTFQADTADTRLCGVLARVGLTELHRLKGGKWSVWARASAP